jgi:hypothetical protein
VDLILNKRILILHRAINNPFKDRRRAGLLGDLEKTETASLCIGERELLQPD